MEHNFLSMKERKVKSKSASAPAQKPKRGDLPSQQGQYHGQLPALCYWGPVRDSTCPGSALQFATP